MLYILGLEQWLSCGTQYVDYSDSGRGSQWDLQGKRIKGNSQVVWEGDGVKDHTVPIVVSLGCPKEVPQSGGLKQQRFIFQRPKGWKSKVKVSAGFVSPGASLHDLKKSAFSLCLPVFPPCTCILCVFQCVQIPSSYRTLVRLDQDLRASITSI